MSFLQTVDSNRLPYGNPEFSGIREQNKIYVDKTKMIYAIASQDAPIFFSRPRRFGKSLLINTLHSLFAHGLKYFKGLDIETMWDDKTYKVAHFDFSWMGRKNAQELKFLLSAKIIKEFADDPSFFDLNSSKMNYPDLILDEIMSRVPNRSIVLLVDEYDAPLTSHIDDSHALESIIDVLNGFYAIVKQYAGRFRLIFITGVTRVSHVSIFSAFNNLLDISLKSKFASLLGFTQAELECFFDVYIQNAAKELKTTSSDIYNLLKEYYDGFRFSFNAKETVYNPWSILSFLKCPEDGLKNYWFQSGGISSIIMKYLKIRNSFDFFDRKERNILINEAELLNRYEINEIPNYILLYQAGYYTLSDGNNGLSYLILPNAEVEESLYKLYFVANNLGPGPELIEKMKGLAASIDSRDLTSIIDVFNEILNECVSCVSRAFSDECSIRDTIYTALLCTSSSIPSSIPGIKISKERDSAKGRSDLEVITSKTCMIVEFKRTYPNRGPRASLSAAIEQITEKAYGMSFLQFRGPFRVAMVISSENKKILPDFCREV